jgi:DNA-binding GntR family transcriptional regulator
MNTNFEINKLSDIPLYIQLKASIKNAILAGQYKEDDRLPTEKLICDFYNISRPVVQKAYQALIDEGLVERRQGSGSYVKRHLVLSNAVFRPDHNAYLKNLNLIPSARLIAFEQVFSESIEALRSEQLTDVFVLKRIRYANQIPIIFEIFYFPIEDYPNLAQQLDSDLSTSKLALEAANGRQIVSNFYMNAIIPDANLCSLFNLDPHKHAVFKYTFFHRYLENGQLNHYKIAYFPGNRHRIDIEAQSHE